MHFMAVKNREDVLFLADAFSVPTTPLPGIRTKKGNVGRVLANGGHKAEAIRQKAKKGRIVTTRPRKR